ncbi:MAG: SDR family oxidoreductase [Oligoflexia bacterium]|nr:SDR family oxidoreductase [Oligoflexia bacterium]
MPEISRIALVTGANRGIGLEVCRQLAAKGLQVILTSRDAAKGEAAAARLREQGGKVRYCQLDTTDEASIQKAHRFVSEQFGRLDVLVNNAGVFLDPSPDEGEAALAANARIETIRKTLETNTIGPFRLCQIFASLMKKNGYGRIINLSSGMGQLSEMNGGVPAYRISKTAINAVTRIFADELQGSGVCVNSVCPGWVKTDMGGPEAELPVEEGADTIVWLATHPNPCPTGTFFRERKPIAW